MSWLKGVTYYASGSNHAGEIEGFTRLGHAIGVTAPKLGEAAIEALERTAGSVPVFVDNGAFGEIAFGANGPEVVKPLRSKDWERIFATYDRLADALGAQLTVVAPDKVAFPQETLARFERYSGRVQAVAAKGAAVLVPLQGADKVAFWAKSQRALGMAEADGLVPALPCKKNATSLAEVIAFCAATQPKRVHLLGLGSANKNARKVVEGIREVAPETEITLDSCLITASVGKSNGRTSHPRETKGGARILTQVNDWLTEHRPRLTTAERKQQAIIMAFGPHKPAQLQLWA